MRRTGVVLAAVLFAAGLVGGLRAASADECPDGPDSPGCDETRVFPDYRPNVIPAFDLADREDADGQGEQQRHDAQRWRAECEDDGEYRQYCGWLYGGQSAFRYPTDDPTDPNEPEDQILTPPNELHAGFAATHCFLAEAAHDCDAHGTNEFDTHDSHGGALYADVCLAQSDDSYWCDDGLQDNQAGVTVVDHLTCPIGCFDEYHVVRPLDPAYTQEQMDDSVAAVQQHATDPYTYVCGYPGSTACPEQ
jgi:hypothetical protein